jgi:hypothetical protein
MKITIWAQSDGRITVEGDGPPTNYAAPTGISFTLSSPEGETILGLRKAFTGAFHVYVGPVDPQTPMCPVEHWPIGNTITPHKATMVMFEAPSGAELGVLK